MSFKKSLVCDSSADKTVFVSHHLKHVAHWLQCGILCLRKILQYIPQIFKSSSVCFPQPGLENNSISQKEGFSLVLSSTWNALNHSSFLFPAYLSSLTSWCKILWKFSRLKFLCCSMISHFLAKGRMTFLKLHKNFRTVSQQKIIGLKHLCHSVSVEIVSWSQNFQNLRNPTLLLLNLGSFGRY